MSGLLCMPLAAYCPKPRHARGDEARSQRAIFVFVEVRLMGFREEEMEVDADCHHDKLGLLWL